MSCTFIFLVILTLLVGVPLTIAGNLRAGYVSIISLALAASCLTNQRNLNVFFIRGSSTLSPLPSRHLLLCNAAAQSQDHLYCQGELRSDNGASDG